MTFVSPFQSLRHAVTYWEMTVFRSPMALTSMLAAIDRENPLFGHLIDQAETIRVVIAGLK
ncbi:hypothetical protein [Burkholderia sp. Tr-20355]|uniref:hypothetical protein n=1 Tax=Burkholderia sp. Tr-20355 TaxID=2703895 RepID=UPI000FA56E4B|nr:hypothetical protein [Burkholderia sp. Tr-20355]MBN3741582.1 hypothetical protein [Burkholderia sp. Tr-20355]RQS81883.1 hypothetical protein DF032_10055 [Burkholderia seminalis]